MTNLKTVTVDLTIKDLKTGKYWKIPVLPEKIEATPGDKITETVEIVDLGQVDFLRGTNLDSVGWSSFFPGRYDSGYVKVANPSKPTEYKKLVEGWKNNGTPLQLVCPAAGINLAVYVSVFTWTLQGFEGDIYYTLSLKQRRTIKPQKLTPGGKAPAKGKKTASSRPSAPTKSRPKTYTVQKNDYLTKIAKHFGIKDWRGQLYVPNKKPKGPLGSNPSLIFPGQVLKLP